MTTQLPAHGRPRTEILETMEAARDHDVHWRDGKVWSLVFHAGDDVSAVAKDAYVAFFSENGLNPTAFPSLRKFETEVVAMTADLLGGDPETVGNMTSGGTESILMAVKTARDWARAHHPERQPPEIVLPRSAHPAFDKAAHYFDVKLVKTPVGDDFRADVEAMRAAISENTIMLVGSAPSYPQGVVDPIREIAALAGERGLLCHVDACVGGFMLPFVRKLGYPIPDFDFSVPGVTSISVDLHKYGYAAKGASVILYRTPALRRFQFFVSTDWPGGIYVSPTMTGTRPGGSIAAAWAVMNYLGEERYLQIASEVMRTAVTLRDGVNATAGLSIMGHPHMSVMAIGSDAYDVFALGDEMGLRGWHLDRQQFPSTLHLTVNYAHVHMADQFLRDLRQSVLTLRKPSLSKVSTSLQVGAVRLASKILPSSALSRLTSASSKFTGVKGASLPTRSAAMYGMMAELPNRGDVDQLVLDLLDQMTREDE